MSEMTEELVIHGNSEASRYEAHIGDRIAVAEYMLNGLTITFTLPQQRRRLPLRVEGADIPAVHQPGRAWLIVDEPAHPVRARRTHPYAGGAGS